MSNYIKGDSLIVEVWDETLGSFIVMSCLTSNSLASTKNIIEAQTKCDPGVIIKKGGSFNYELTFEGNLVDSDASWEWLSNKMNGDAVEFPTTKELLEFRIQTGLTDNPYYYGEGFISDLALDASAGDEFATFSGTVSISGRLSLYSSKDEPTATVSYWKVTANSTPKEGEIYVKDLDLTTGGPEFGFNMVDGFGFDWSRLMSGNLDFTQNKSIRITQPSPSVIGSADILDASIVQGKSYFNSNLNLTVQFTPFTEGGLCKVEFY